MLKTSGKRRHQARVLKSGHKRGLPGLVVLVSLGVLVPLSMMQPFQGVAQASTRKVALIVLENKPYTKIVGSASAPYMNSLISQGQLFTDYHAIRTGSSNNYRAMSSGRTDVVSPLPQNIFRTIDQTAGLTWKSFQESMGGNCGVLSSGTVPGTTKPLYSRGHDASYMYRGNESCATNDVPLVSDSQLSSLPDFSVIIPNQCNDMHTYPATGTTCPSYFGSVSGADPRRIGDSWLKHVVPVLLADPAVTVIVTFDEGTTKSGQRVYAVEVGGAAPGTTDASTYNHYGLLAGLYQHFGLGTAPNNASTATPLPIPA